MKDLNNMEKAKRGELLKALITFKWNISAACHYLGISRATYYRNKVKYKLEKSEHLGP